MSFMISALSRLPQLNGNRLLIALFLGLTVSSCALFRKAETEEEPKEIGEELDPLPGKKIYDPETGQLVIVDETPVETMDTIKWKVISADSIPPIQSGEGIAQEEVMGNPSKLIERGDFGTEFYTSYNVTVLLPFLSDRFNPESNEIFRNSTWALNYYGGMQMALDELDEQGVKLNVRVMDSKAQEAAVGKLLNTRSELYNSHLIIGPYRSDNVEMVAEFARRNNKTYVSPHSASANIPTANPNYIQVSPTLQSHCQAITQHAYENYGRKKIVLVSRDKEVERARFNYFQEEIFRLEGRIEDSLRLREYVVEVDDNDEERFGNIDLSSFMTPGDTTVFIVPSWSNESFIYSFLSQAKLSKNPMNPGREPTQAQPSPMHVVVYGMPQWQEYERIDFDLYESLNVHISSDAYLDSYSDDVRFFRRKFYNRFGVTPGEEAFLAYDVTRYFGRMLNDYGTKFQYQLEQEPAQMLHTRFDFERVVRPTTTGMENPPIQKFENKHVNILKFQDYQFQSANLR